MIRIDYTLSPQWNATATPIDLSRAEEMDLRYGFFMGDLLLTADGVDLSAAWGWVTILDAAAGLRRVVAELTGGEKRATFDFTESDATIQFETEGPGIVCLSSSYAAGRACVTLDELRSAVFDFVERVLADALARYPELTHNTQLRRWYPAPPPDI